MKKVQILEEEKKQYKERETMLLKNLEGISSMSLENKLFTPYSRNKKIYLKK